MRTALLEMRTALLEMPTAKLLRTNDKNNFIATKFCCLKNESWKWHSESEFYYPGELSYGEVLQSESKERYLNPLANEENSQLSQKPELFAGANFCVINI